MEFYYTLQVESEEPIMLIDRHVGYDEEDGYGVMGDLFCRELLQLDTMGKKRIQVWINSIGGVVTDGMQIYNTILKTKTKVDTYNVGMAASIAAVIWQAGRKRYANDFAITMLHNPSGGDNNEVLTKVKEGLVTMIASRSGKDATDISKMMTRTTWLSANECLAHGFCDEIEDSGEWNKPRKKLDNYTDVKMAWKEAALVLNKSITDQTIQPMKKITNKLGLNEAANEDSVLKAIEEIINKGEKTLADLNSANAKISDLQKTNGELTNKVSEFEKIANDAKKAAVKVEAETLVNKAVEEGKLAESAKTVWINKAETDLDGVKALLEAMPVTRTNPLNNQFKSENAGKPGKLNMAAKMAEIANKHKAN